MCKEAHGDVGPGDDDDENGGRGGGGGCGGESVSERVRVLVR